MSFSLTLSVKRINVKVTLLLYFLRQVLYTPTGRNGDIMCICMHLKIHLNYLYVVLRTRMDLMADQTSAKQDSSNKQQATLTPEFPNGV